MNKKSLGFEHDPDAPAFLNQRWGPSLNHDLPSLDVQPERKPIARKLPNSDTSRKNHDPDK